MIERTLAISLLVAGMALAQTATTPAPTQGTTPAPRGRGLGFGRGPGRGPDVFGPKGETRLTTALALNATQQNNLHQVLASTKVQEQGMREKETTLRTQLAAAVKTGSEGSIDSTATEIETLHQQRTSIRAKALAAVYSSLTPAQQVKFVPMMNRELGLPGGPGRGPGGRGPRTANGAQTTAQPQ
jgi:Spy/CpxP family protein refolding chaperone